LIHGSDEILPAFLILAHQVFGPLQEFFRSWISESHGRWQYRSGESQKCSTANKSGKEATRFVFDFGAKVLTMGAPKGLLCAVASQRRSAKWKRKARALDAVLRGSG